MAENPTFAIFMWSNYAPDFGEVEGGRRRTAVERYDNRFGNVAAPEDGDFLDDGQLKYRIQRGEYRLQQLWCAVPWIAALRLWSTSIPKPAAIRRCTSAVVPHALRVWADGALKQAPTSTAAATTKEIKEAAAAVVGCSVRSQDLVTQLISAGFTLDAPTAGNKKRGVKYKFQLDQPAVWVVLK